MQYYEDVADVAQGFGPSAVTIGKFDGVHVGHRAVIAHLEHAAARQGLVSTVVTFDRHPLSVLRPEAAPVPLVTSARRVELLEEAGLDAALVLPFTRELAAVEATAFVEEWLFGALRAQVVVVGDDARYGRASRGDIALLRHLGEQHGVEVVGLDAAQGEAARRKQGVVHSAASWRASAATRPLQ